MPCRANYKFILTSLFLGCVLGAGGVAPVRADSVSFVRGGDTYQYDARMAFLKAGELDLAMHRHGDAYEVEGQFKTSRAMSAYYSWNGFFAARGRWEASGPVTTAYMARTSGKDEDLKIVLNTENGVRLLEGRDQNFTTVDKPEGNDLISALFFSPTCFAGGVVHDGEDPYHLTLREQSQRYLSSSNEGYFAGDVVDCDYDVRDHKDRRRRVVVSLAQVGDTVVAVQLRAKIPVLPDAVFRLRVPRDEPVTLAAR